MIGRVRQWLARWGTVAQRRDEALADYGTDDFVQQMRHLRPDLCIIDIELSAHIMTAHALGIRTATIASFISLRKYPRVPPLHTDIVPQMGWRGSAWGIEWAWLRFRLWKRWMFTLQWLRAAGADPISVLRLHAQRIGFAFDTEIDQYQWLMPFIFRSIPLLYTNAREKDFPHTPHPASRHLGPMILPKRQDAQANGDAAAIDHLLARRQEQPTRKLIYAAFGAFFKGDDSGFFRRIIDAVAGEPNWDVIIGMGGRGNANALGALPVNVHVFAWVPQLRVLEYADAAVIHGGIGTMNECIFFGVPMLTYPFKNTNDQMGAAARIGYHQLGLVGDRDHDQPADIQRKIAQLLTDAQYRTKVGEMRRTFQQYADEQRAASIIAELLAAPAPTATIGNAL
jgi:zeaxanthin glucosyltransferase